MTAPYDSRADTIEHIHAVRNLLLGFAGDLLRRARWHDASKLLEPEKEMFDEYTPKLRDTTYGSEEYERYRAEMGKALDHHYEVNDHHPEHFTGGIAEMGLQQLTEMFCDWLAATQRHADGDIFRSIEVNAERFGYGEEIARLLRNTATATMSDENHELATHTGGHNSGHITYNQEACNQYTPDLIITLLTAVFNDPRSATPDGRASILHEAQNLHTWNTPYQPGMEVSSAHLTNQETQ